MGIIRFLFTVMSWLPVLLVWHLAGPRATTVNNVHVLLRHDSTKYLGCDVRKPVFGVSDEVRFKPTCSASETE